jgi:hypothetical protein
MFDGLDSLLMSQETKKRQNILKKRWKKRTGLQN